MSRILASSPATAPWREVLSTKTSWRETPNQSSIQPFQTRFCMFVPRRFWKKKLRKSHEFQLQWSHEADTTVMAFWWDKTTKPSWHWHFCRFTTLETPRFPPPSKKKWTTWFYPILAVNGRCLGTINEAVALQFVEAPRSSRLHMLGLGGYTLEKNWTLDTWNHGSWKTEVCLKICFFFDFWVNYIWIKLMICKKKKWCVYTWLGTHISHQGEKKHIFPTTNEGVTQLVESYWWPHLRYNIQRPLGGFHDNHLGQPYRSTLVIGDSPTSRWLIIHRVPWRKQIPKRCLRPK